MKKLLIADDAPDIRLLISLMMEEEYKVINASDGVEAIKLAKEEKPDVILMDIMMPNIDGIQATLEIKNNPETKHIPIIMLTALSDSESVMTSYDYGADHYLIKPFIKEKLLRALDIVQKPKERGL